MPRSLDAPARDEAYQAMLEDQRPGKMSRRPVSDAKEGPARSTVTPSSVI